MEKFKVVVWCDSCRGDDEEGCFGGSEEVIGEAFASWDEEEVRFVTANRSGPEKRK